jgi:hypothetical protein
LKRSKIKNQIIKKDKYQMSAVEVASFLGKFGEKAELNKYWYSARTISRIIEELCVLKGRIGFLSTPSLYFSLPEDVRQDCFVFDVSV